MTQEQAISKMLEVRAVVMVSFERKAWVEITHVSDSLNRNVLLVLEELGLIEVRGGMISPSMFRVKAQGYKLARKYK